MWVTPNSFPNIENINVEKNPRFGSLDGLLVDKTAKKLVVCPGAKKGSNLEIDSSIEIIGTYAFAYCNWGTITIGQHVRTIEDYAFREAVVNLVIDSSNLEIGVGGIFKINGTITVTGTNLHVKENGLYISEAYEGPPSTAKLLAGEKTDYLMITGSHHTFDSRSLYASKLSIDANYVTYASRTLLTPKTYQTFTSFSVKGDGCETNEYAFTLVNSDGLTQSDFNLDLTNLKANGALGSLQNMGSISITFSEIEGSPLSGISTPAEIQVGFGDGVTSIPENALSGDGLLSGEFIISKNIQTIAKNAFAGQTKITSFTVEQENQWFKSVDGILYNTQITDLILFPEGKTGEFILPDTLTTFDAQFLAMPLISAIKVQNNQAFSEFNGILMSKDQSKVIKCPGARTGDFACPSSVTEIGPYSFHKCTLGTVSIESHVKMVNSHAFDSCTCTSMSIKGDGMTLNDGCMHYICGDVTITGTKIIFNKDSIAISVADSNYNHFLKISGTHHEFKSGSLASIVMELDVDNCHFYTGATNASKSSSVFSVKGDSNIFEADSLNSAEDSPNVEVDRSVMLTNVDSRGRLGALKDFSLINVSFGNMQGESTLQGVENVKTLEVEILDTVTEIPVRAFYGMTNLEDTVVIPGSVGTVHESAFNGAARITTVMFKNTGKQSKVTIGPAAFANCLALSRVVFEYTKDAVIIDETAFANAISALKLEFAEANEPDGDNTAIIVVSVLIPLVVIAAIIIIVVILMKRRKDKNASPEDYVETLDASVTDQ